MGRKPEYNATESGEIMILVDTSVIIDFIFGTTTKQTTYLEHIIEKGEIICTCGPILAEVLQGCKTEKLYRQYFDAMSELVYIGATKMTHIKAAEIYRDLRKKGVTPRGTIDCIIAAICIEHELLLLHNDKDFSSIAKHTALKMAMK